MHFQNCSLKIALLNNKFLKLLPQKIHFQNSSVKKYFFKKDTFLKLLSQQIYFKIAL